MLLEAIPRIETSQSDGLVVAKLDRFGRSLVSSLRAIERIQRAGGIFVSVADGIDLTTETGRFVLRTLLSVAELELDRVRANWWVATEKAIERGVFIGSCAPTGYRRGRDGRLIPHSVIGPIVTELFDRRAGGATYADIAAFCESTGQRTAVGNVHWTAASVRHIIGNRVYLGELWRGELVNRAAHRALVDAPTWERAQRPRYVPRKNNSVRGPSLLGGLIRCAGCRMVMAAGGAPDGHGGRTRQYGCLTKRAHSGRCSAPAFVHGTVIEPYAETIFFELIRRRRPRSSAELTRAEKDLARAEHSLADYRDNEAIQRSLGRDGFTAGIAKRAETVRRARLRVHDERS